MASGGGSAGDNSFLLKGQITKSLIMIQSIRITKIGLVCFLIFIFFWRGSQGMGADMERVKNECGLVA